MEDVIRRGISVEGNGYAADYPAKCPMCHHHSEIKQLQSVRAANGTEVQVVFQCAFEGCKSFFIGYYPPNREPQLKSLRPTKPMLSQFPECVSRLSPQFIAIFQEAEEAAHLGLSQIAGPGYRKAYEFLIKDYATSLSPEKSDQIKYAFSGSVVNDFISDSRIQSVAKRALWLGNDETHYLRKWEAHYIGDLVTLIKLTVNWIEIEQLSKNYVETMPG